MEERPSPTQGAVQTDFTQVSAGWRFLCKFAHAVEGLFRRTRKKGLGPHRGCTDRLYTGQCWIEDAVGLTHAAEGPFRRTWKKGLCPHRGCTDRLYTGQYWMEDILVGSPMQLRDPLEERRKALAHTEAVQTDFTQVSVG